jgi:nicotinamide mononucleotide transporter
MRDFLISIAVAVVLTGVSYLVAVQAGWIDEVNWLEAFSVFTSYSCTYLCVRQSRWNYPIGAVSVAALVVVFAQAGLYGSAALNAYLLPALLYGWFRWGPDTNTRPVRHVELSWIPAYLAVTAGAYLLALGAAATAVSRFGGEIILTPADVGILVGSILAQFLLDNKRIETWAVWAVVNVVAIATYAQAGLPLISLQFVFFLGNSLYGWVSWQRSMAHA